MVVVCTNGKILKELQNNENMLHIKIGECLFRDSGLGGVVAKIKNEVLRLKLPLLLIQFKWVTVK